MCQHPRMTTQGKANRWPASEVSSELDARKFVTVVSIFAMIFLCPVSPRVFALIMIGCVGWFVLRLTLWRARQRAWDTALGFVPLFVFMLGFFQFPGGPSIFTSFFAFMAFFATEGLMLKFFLKRIAAYCRIDLEPEAAP